MDGWNTIVSFWDPAYFFGGHVSFREGRSWDELEEVSCQNAHEFAHSLETAVVLVASSPNPYAPRDWYIYLHLP